MLSFLFSVRSGLLFTDPITGFRCYRRKEIVNKIKQPRDAKAHIKSPSELSLFLINEGVDIGEISVSYRTYSGFTDPAWRIRRALRSLYGLLWSRSKK